MHRNQYPESYFAIKIKDDPYTNFNIGKVYKHIGKNK